MITCIVPGWTVPQRVNDIFVCTQYIRLICIYHGWFWMIIDLSIFSHPPQVASCGSVWRNALWCLPSCQVSIPALWVFSAHYFDGRTQQGPPKMGCWEPTVAAQYSGLIVFPTAGSTTELPDVDVKLLGAKRLGDVWWRFLDSIPQESRIS